MAPLVRRQDGASDDKEHPIALLSALLPTRAFPSSWPSYPILPIDSWAEIRPARADTTYCCAVVDSGTWADRVAAFFSSLLFPFSIAQVQDERPRGAGTTRAYDVLSSTEARGKKNERVSERAPSTHGRGPGR